MTEQVDKTDERRTLTVPEAALAIGISTPAYYNAVKRKEVPGLIVGRRVVVPRAQLDKFVAGEEWKTGAAS